MTDIRAVPRHTSSAAEQRALADLQARYRTLLDSSLDAIVGCDDDGSIVEFNRAAERLLGHEASDALGRPVAEVLVPLRHRGAFADLLARFRRGDPPETGFEFDTELLRAAGDEVAVHVSIGVAQGPARRVFIGCLRDVGDVRAARESLIRVLRDNEAILNAAGDGIVRLDADGSIAFVNATAAAMLGWEAGELLGKPAHDTFHRAPGEPDDTGADCPIIAAGRDGQVHRADSETFRRRDGATMAVELISAPVWNDGRLAGSVVTFRDVTQRRAMEEHVRRSRDMFRFLARVSSVMGEVPLDPDDRVRALARELVPARADWCAFDLLDDAGALRRVVVEHVDPCKIETARRLHELYPPDPDAAIGSWAVIRSCRPQLIAAIDDQMLVQSARGAEHLELLRSLGLSSALIVPLVSRDRVLGTMLLVTAESGRRLTEDDVDMYREVGLRAGSMIENARLFIERSRVAQTLQESLLPPVLPDIEGADIATRYVSGTTGVDVGGDFYDIFPTDPDDWVVVLGDVSGKGAEAAAMTALARHTIRAAAIAGRKPSFVLGTLHRAIIAQDTGRFCTACYVRVRPSQAGLRLTIGRGGHPQPLILRAGGRLEEISSHGTALGLIDEVELVDRSARLKPGDTLILFTDGVTEARCDRGLLGERTLRGFLRSMAGKSAGEIASGVEQLALDWQDDRPRDDIAIVVVQARRLNS